MNAQILAFRRNDLGMPATVIDPQILRWRTWQLAQGLSPVTIKERLRVVARMAEHAGVPATDVTTDELMSWLADVPTRPAKSAYFQAIRSWFRWLMVVDLRVDDPTAKVRTPRRPRVEPHPVPSEYLPLLLVGRMYSRTRAMVLLALMAGLRVHEIAKIKGEDLDLIGNRLRVTGKGGVRAYLPLHPLLAELAAEMPRAGYWFPARGDRAGHVLGRSVSTLIGSAMRRNGVPGSAHSLRHWYGTTLLRGGADLRTTQELLRHSSVATTQIYTQVSEGSKVRAIRRLDPFHPALLDDGLGDEIQVRAG